MVTFVFFWLNKSRPQTIRTHRECRPTYQAQVPLTMARRCRLRVEQGILLLPYKTSRRQKKPIKTTVLRYYVSGVDFLVLFPPTIPQRLVLAVCCVCNMHYKIRGATVRCTRWTPEASHHPECRQWSPDQPSSYLIVAVSFLPCAFYVLVVCVMQVSLGEDELFDEDTRVSISLESLQEKVLSREEAQARRQTVLMLFLVAQQCRLSKHTFSPHICPRVEFSFGAEHGCITVAYGVQDRRQ